MANISPEQLRDISISAVEDFLNNKVPLSVGLAKQAAAYELNEEQVKRAVESTNNIAYLKVLQLSEDRTVEFPLAKYAEVMASATLPDNFQEKVAATISVENKNIEKTASAYQMRELEFGEKITYFVKEASANKESLERLQIESITVVDTLVKTAKAIGKDEKWMDKLACVTSEQEFKELSVLVSGSVQKYRDLAGVGLFKEAQLKDVTNFSNLYKQARELVREQRERSSLQKQAAETTQGIKTNSFVNTMNNVSAGAKNVVNKTIGAPGYAAGYVAGRVAKTPIEAGKAVGNAAIKSVKTNTQAIIGAGEKSQAVAVTKAVGKTSGSALKGVWKAANPVMDAALYDPGTDSHTGRSNDVWSALQRD
jgi:hypothetical protein